MTTPRIDLWLGGQWVDTTSRVRKEPAIAIERGRANEQSKVGPSRAPMVINNRDGLFSPRNPTGTYYGQIGRNTPVRIAIPEVTDSFARTASSGWGTSDSGHAWTVVGTASDYNAGSGVGTISLGSVGTARSAYLAGVSRKDTTIAARFSPGVVATGAAVDMAIIARRVDADNHYFGIARFGTDGTVTAMIAKRVAGTNTLLALSGDSFAYTASTDVGVEFVLIGSYLSLRVCDLATPTNASTVTDTDTTFTAAGTVGVRAILNTSNSNTTPVVVEVDNFRVDDVRFSGEVPAWPQRWDTTGSDVWAPIDAAGIVRRLGQTAVLRSALYRYITTLTDANEIPLGYWPLEDAAGSTRAAPAVGDKYGVVVGTQITFAAGDGPAGSGQVPSVAGTNGSPATSCIIGYPAGTALGVGRGWYVACWFRASGTTASFSPIEIVAYGDLPIWRVVVSNAAVTLTVYDATGASVMTDSLSGDFLDDAWHLVTVAAVQSSASTVQADLCIDATLDQANASTYTLGNIARWRTPGNATPSNINSAYVGHILVSDGPNSLDFQGRLMYAASGFTGEAAGARIARLCAEEGIAFVSAGDLADTHTCGPQRIATLLDLVQDAADVDGGILYEPRQVFGLGYRTLRSQYNQTATLELDYESGHLFGELEPADDDQLTRNAVTVSRYSGSSTRRVMESGPLAAVDPADGGVGVYETSLTLNAETDGQLDNLAGWRLGLGTWDEVRYPTVEVALHGHAYAASASLTTAATLVDLGALISVENLPAWMPPGVAELLVQGSVETVDQFERWIRWNCVPAGPYQVGVWDTGRYDTAGSELTSAVTSGATSFDVATTSGPLWTADNAEDGFDILAGGERMTVTDIAPAAITYVAAGTVAHGNNASVSASLPAGIQSGDLLLIWAAIRNSGTGTVDTPTGYTLLLDSSNARLFGKIAGASEAAPTVTFTGGAANADTSAQTAAFRGKFYNIENVAVGYTAECLNASAQDITYPGLHVPEDNCLILYLGWKQDDWTSVAAISGATEIGEPDTTTGDDQGIVWNYQIQTTATGIGSGVFTVTGGASAISRGGIIALRSDVQTFTVTRSVNGVTKAHAAGTDVSLYRPMRWAL